VPTQIHEGAAGICLLAAEEPAASVATTVARRLSRRASALDRIVRGLIRPCLGSGRVGARRLPDRGTDGSKQLGLVDRLQEVGLATQAPNPLRVARLIVARDDKNRQALRGKPLKDLEPVGIGHVKIQQQAVGKARGASREKRVAVCERHDVEAVGLQETRKRPAKLRLVVHHGNQRPSFIHGAILAKRRRARYWTLVKCPRRRPSAPVA
jgi:hypothetical protein